jgi:hypothetical protein
VAKNAKPVKEFNEKAKQAVEQTKEQIPGAVDNYVDFLQKTISSYPSGGTELGEKLKGYAEKNIVATQEFIHKLGHAKDFQGVIQIQTEFMQAQMNAVGAQTWSLGEASAKAAEDAIKTQVTFNRSSQRRGTHSTGISKRLSQF